MCFARLLPPLLLLAACSAPGAPAANVDRAAAAAATLDALHADAARADGAAWFAHFAPESRYVGTDASEHWDLAALHAFADPYFARGQGWTFVPGDRWITIAADGDVAWFEERLDNAKYGATRGSGVLVWRAGRWLVAQYVLSFAVPNELADDVVALVRAR
jgi:hypothetical protein